MKFSCCTGLENLDHVKSAGYDRIILPGVELVEWTEEKLEYAVKRLKSSGLECRALNSFCSAGLRLCGPGVSFDKVSEYIAFLASRAQKLGVRYIGVGAPKSRAIPDGYNQKLAMEQWLRTIRILCAGCTPYGITILLEAVCSMEGNWMTTTQEALEVLEQAGAPNLQIVFDAYHACKMGEDPRLLYIAAKHIPLVHMAQDIMGQRHYLRWENFEEYKQYIHPLLCAGFDGEISVEAFYGGMQTHLHETLQIMKALCEDGTFHHPKELKEYEGGSTT